MRWVRSGLVLSLFGSVGIAFSGTPQIAQAAPMTGVVFAPPVQVFDSLSLGPTYPAQTHALGSAQAQLLQVTVVPNAFGAVGVVMMHDCNVAPNPATDAILPIDPVIGSFTNQVYTLAVPGGTCLTSTTAASRLTIRHDADVLAAPPGTGSAYVDIPFTFVTTITGPVTNAPLDFTGFGVPANASGLAMWLDSLSTTQGFAAVHPCGSPGFTVQALWVADVPASNLVAGVASAGAHVCIDISDGASVDVSIDGYYSPTDLPTNTSAPQVRYSQQRAPGFVAVTPTRLFDTRDTVVPLTGGQVLRLDLSTDVPLDTTAVVMNVTVTNPVAAGFVSVFPCDGPQPPVSNLNYLAGQTVPNLVTVDVGSTLEVCFFSLQTTHLIADLAGYYVLNGGDGFTPASPLRMVDTRGLAAQVVGRAQLPAGATLDFNASIFLPPDATAVVFNLTATDVGGPGFVTAFPCDQQLPTASNLNVVAGQTVPNLVTVKLSATGHVCLFTTSKLNLIADLAGWYSPSSTSGFIAIPPDRWADTRQVFADPLPAGDIEGLGFDVSFPGATAMVFNATATEAQAAGFLTAFPCGLGTPPNVSNVNFVAGQTVPNMVIAATRGSDVCVFTSAPTHWIVDIGGFFTTDPIFLAVFPPGTDNL